MTTVTVPNVTGTGDTAQTTPVSASAAAAPPSSRVVGWSIAAVIVAIVAMCLAYKFVIKPVPLKIASSYVPYAAVVAAAAALERFLEPLSNYLMNTKSAAAKANATTTKAAAQSMGADPAKDADEVQTATQSAADAQAEVDTERANRAVFFWAIASICGIVMAGGFGFFLLQSIATSGVNPYLDIAVTGLAIGAGTKPTHDLITSLQAKSSGAS